MACSIIPVTLNNSSSAPTALGFQAYTPLSFVQGINNFYQILQVIFGGVGAITLLVATMVPEVALKYG